MLPGRAIIRAINSYRVCARGLDDEGETNSSEERERICCGREFAEFGGALIRSLMWLRAMKYARKLAAISKIPVRTADLHTTHDPHVCVAHVRARRSARETDRLQHVKRGVLHWRINLARSHAAS